MGSKDVDGDAKGTDDTEPFYADYTASSKTKSKSGQPAAIKMVEEIIYWKDPKISAGVLVTGLAWFYFTTIGGYTIISLLSILAGVHLAGSVFYHSILAFRGHETPGGGKAPQIDIDAAKKSAEGLASQANAALQWYWSLLGASNLMSALYVSGVLLVTCALGSWFDAYTYLFLAFVVAFSVPVAYQTNQAVCDDFVDKIKAQFNQAVSVVQAKIPRAGKAADGKKDS